MRNAVFFFDLRSRNFEVAAVLEFAIDNVVNRQHPNLAGRNYGTWVDFRHPTRQ